MPEKTESLTFETAIKKLEEATRRATEDKEVRGKIESMYTEVEFLNTEDLRKFAEAIEPKWGPVIKKANIVTK